MRTLLVVLAAWFFAACGADHESPPSRSRGPGKKAPVRAVVSVPFDATQSAGFFAGVRSFPNDDSLPAVPYAVDDAVDLAHRFALAERLIPANRVVLALAGEPQKSGSVKRLEELLAAGARVTEAYRVDIEHGIEGQAAEAGEGGLLIVAFATHGVRRGGWDYLLTESSLDRDLAETSLLTTRMNKLISASRAQRRLVLLDACRSYRKPGSRSSPGGFDPTRSLGAEGFALLSARPGAALYDDPVRGQGVFTAAVLEALTCAGDRAVDRQITIDELADHVNDEVAAFEKAAAGSAGKRVSGGIARYVEGSLGRFPLVHCP